MAVKNSGYNYDIPRRIVRRCIGYDNPVYRLGALVTEMIVTSRKESFATWRMLKAIQSQREPAGTSVSIQLNMLQHPISLRAGTEDAQVVIDDVIREQYGKFDDACAPKWIIDAGAYIGDTAAYFLSRFPDARVISFEPNPPTYERAALNLSPYGERVELLQKGLAGKDAVLHFGGEFGQASIRESGIRVECTSITSVIDKYSIPRIDIMKLDIEGAEVGVFTQGAEAWIDRVDRVIIEIHGPAAEYAVLGVLRAHGFQVQQYRSVWYCCRARGLETVREASL